jgi:hypothetical protein
VTIRRDDVLGDTHYRPLMIWASNRDEHVLGYCIAQYLEDDDPSKPIKQARETAILRAPQSGRPAVLQCNWRSSGKKYYICAVEVAPA